MVHKYKDIYRKLSYLTQNKTYSFEDRLNEAYSKLIKYIESFSDYEKMKFIVNLTELQKLITKTHHFLKSKII